MNKIVIPATAIALLAAAGGGWYVYAHGGQPMANAQAMLAKGDVRGAQIELRNAVKADPNNGEAHFRLGELQLKSGDPIAAEKELLLARQTGFDPGAVTPLLGQAILAQRRFADVLTTVPAEAGTPEMTARFLVLRSVAQIGVQDIPAAQASLAAAERAAPQDLETKLASARLFLGLRDPVRAEQKVNEALAIDPARGEALLLKGQMKASSDPAGSLALIDSAVEAAPSNMLFKLERANQLIAAGQDAKAQADVSTVLTAEPRNAPATYLQAVLNVRAGKFAEADAELGKLGPAIQSFPRGLFMEAVAKANLGQMEQAVDSATRYNARYPADPEGVRLLSRLEISAKRPARAVELLEKAVAAGVKDAETLDMLGRAYTAAGRSDDAAKSFQRASEEAPRNPTILANLAASRLQLGDSFGASNALERSLDIAPGQSSAGEALVATALSSGDLDRAVQALDRLRAQNGETESVGLLTGLIEIARQNLEGARTQFAAVVQKFPQSVSAKLNLAKVLILQGKRPEGETVLRQVLDKEPANPQALNTLLQMLVQESRLPAAVAAAEAARKAQPQDGALTVVLSDLLVRAGDSKKALETLDSGRVNGQLPVPLMLAQARAQFASGAVDTAKSTYKQVLQIQPTELEARRALTELLINRREFPEATAVLKDGLRTSPGNLGMMSTLLAIEQRTSGTPAAIAMAEELRRDPGNMPASVVLKGDAYLASQRYGDAAAAYAAEMRDNPSTALVIRQAQALSTAGGTEQATTVLRDWIGKNPTDAEAAQMLASFDITAKRLPEAERNLKIVLDRRPNDAIALNNLAWVYQQRGNGLARQTAQRAYLLAPGAETADTLGWILVTENKPDQALPLLQQALAAKPDDRNMMVHLATAQKALGQKDEALKNVKAALADTSEFDEKRAAIQLLDQLGGK